MSESGNKMMVVIYKRRNGFSGAGKFCVVPALERETLDNRTFECGYVYELDLDTGKIGTFEYFEEPVGRFDDKYERVGWGEIGRLDCWNIAPAALGMSLTSALPYGCALNKDFRKDEE